MTNWTQPNCPVLFVILNNFFNRRSYVFEVWVDSEKVLGNLNLATAISSFLHLCFCFDLKYPKVKPRIYSFFLIQILRNLRLLLTCFREHLPSMGTSQGQEPGKRLHLLKRKLMSFTLFWGGFYQHVSLHKSKIDHVDIPHPHVSCDLVVKTDSSGILTVFIFPCPL